MQITRESTIKAQFNYLCGGRVEKVKKPKDFAFVHFINHEAAEEAYNRSVELKKTRYVVIGMIKTLMSIKA